MPAPDITRCLLMARPSAFAHTSKQLQVHAALRRDKQPASSQLWTRPFWRPARCSMSSRRPIASSPAQKLVDSAPSLARGPGQHRQSTTSTIPQSSPPPLPAYTPPTTGLLSHLPSSWIPYAELARYDKPSGASYLFLPCLFSTLLAAPLTIPITPPETVLATTALFYAGALIMRGAGCTINDLWDRNLDPHVTRTRLRPLARRAVTPFQAVSWLGAQLAAGLAVLLQFPASCFYNATPSLLLVCLYPLAKRVTNYPQFVLGLTFSWGAIVGFPALGLDLLASTPHLVAAGCLYASCVAWTLVYDMIYAYQDIRDDPKAGIKSIALAQAKHPKTFLASAAAAQVGLLAGAGLAIGAGPVYFGGVCGGAAATLGYMIWKVDLGSVSDCWAWFRKGAWFVGGAISAGLGAEYVVRWFGWDGRKVEGVVML